MPGEIRPFILFHSHFTPFITRKNPTNSSSLTSDDLIFHADFFLAEKLIEGFSYSHSSKASSDNKNGSCFAMNSTLSKWLNISERNVTRCLKYLVTNGYIKTELDGRLMVKKSMLKNQGNVGIYSDFIRNIFIKPMPKMVAILLWMNRNIKDVSNITISKLHITRRTFQNHIKTLRDLNIIEKDSYSFINPIGPIFNKDIHSNNQSIFNTNMSSVISKVNNAINCNNNSNSNFPIVKDTESILPQVIAPNENSMIGNESLTTLSSILPELRIKSSENQYERKDIPDVKEKTDISISLKNLNKEDSTLYINILGETCKQPEDTNPVVSFIKNREEEEKAANEIKAKQLKHIEDNCLSLFDNEYNLLYDDINMMFPSIPTEPKIQAVFQTKQKANSITINNKLSYAIGIINNYNKLFSGRDHIPTVIRLTDIEKKMSNIVINNRRKSEESINAKIVMEIESINHTRLKAIPECDIFYAVEAFLNDKDPRGLVLKKIERNRVIEMIASDTDFLLSKLPSYSWVTSISKDNSKELKYTS